MKIDVVVYLLNSKNIILFYYSYFQINEFFVNALSQF